jgi:hypothetical protein
LAVQNRDKTPEQIATNTYVEKKVEALAPIVIDQYVQVYASLFNETQLMAIAKFFSSPAGRRLSAQGVEVVQEIVTRQELSVPSPGKQVQAVEEGYFSRLRRSGLSDQDLAEVVAFQRSSTGEALRANRSALEAGAAKTAKFVMNFATHVRMERFCDRAHCTPQMRGWIDRDLPLTPAEHAIADSP